jgi:Fic family protein
MAVAHIEAERELELRYAGPSRAPQLYSATAVADIHRSLFARLPSQDLTSERGVPVEPGSFRTREVSVGRHVAPAADSVARLLERWGAFYGGVRRGEAALLALAAAHQRLGWVHPFIDGNGRVMRLHTHTMLHALGYTGGVWSPLRGFARSVERYYALLAAADEPRPGRPGRPGQPERGCPCRLDRLRARHLPRTRCVSCMGC